MFVIGAPSSAADATHDARGQREPRNSQNHADTCNHCVRVFTGLRTFPASMADTAEAADGGASVGDGYRL